MYKRDQEITNIPLPEKPASRTISTRKLWAKQREPVPASSAGFNYRQSVELKITTKSSSHARLVTAAMLPLTYHFGRKYNNRMARKEKKENSKTQSRPKVRKLSAKQIVQDVRIL